LFIFIFVFIVLSGTISFDAVIIDVVILAVGFPTVLAGTRGKRQRKKWLFSRWNIPTNYDSYV
jgi:hypothetical protein